MLRPWIRHRGLIISSGKCLTIITVSDMLKQLFEAQMNKWRSALRLIGMGWYISISILLGVLVGRWVDNKLETEPFLMIIGLIFGIVVAFYGVYKMLPRVTNNSEGE